MVNKYLPININVSRLSCLVVGGGNVALRKVETLMDYETKITVIAPDVDAKIEYYASKGKIKLDKRPYAGPEASKYGLVVSASDNTDVNRQVYDDCQAANIPVNVVDNPPLCTFIFPAMLRRDCLSVAISTDGKAPFLAAHLRLILENIFPDHWKKIARLAGEFRHKVQERWAGDTTQRFASLDRFLSADWKSLIKEKDDDALRMELDLMLEPDSAAEAEADGGSPGDDHDGEG